MKKESAILKIVGGVAIAVAIGGLWYNFSGLLTFLTNREHDPEIPYFLPVFVTMSAICVVCYVFLILSGVQFIRGRLGVFPLFKGVLVFEVIYFFSIGAMWLIPKIGMSIAAASGVANGGLMLQAFILFPLWAIPAVKLTKRKQEESSNQAFEATS